MCYSLRKIRNRTLQFHPEYDSAFLTVPCGQCGECRQQKVNGMIIRSYYEWKACQDFGGISIFVTFTYNQKHLPHFILNGKEYPCFQKKDYQKFMDLLRKHLQRKYGVPPQCVKVIWTSEFGGKTHRPHYHAIIYIYDTNITPSAIRHLITMDWHHGFVKFGKYGGVVNSIFACKYVSKYINKDLDFFGFIDKNDLEDLKENDYNEYKRLRRTYFPFHTCSQQFGMAILDYVSYSDIFSGVINLPGKNGMKSYHLPMYYDRKIFYYLDSETKSYRLTLEGVEMKVYRHEAYTEKAKADTLSMMENIGNYLDTCVLQDINKYFHHKYTREDIVNIYNNFLDDFGIDIYFDYMETRLFFTEDIRVEDRNKADFIEPKPYRNRMNKYNETAPWECCGKLQGHLLRLPLVKDNYFSLERFAELHDKVRFVLGQYKDMEYRRLQEQWAQAKQIKDLYDCY